MVNAIEGINMSQCMSMALMSLAKQICEIGKSTEKCV